MRLMHVVCTLLCLTFPLLSALPARAVTPQEAAQYVGQSATITGTVSQVHFDRRSGNIFINMGGHFPNHVFYGIIFSGSSGAFDGVERLTGHTVQSLARSNPTMASHRL